MHSIMRLASRLGLTALLGLAATTSNATVTEYVHTDALGSIVAITDSNRAVLERREYEPFGEQLTPAVQNGPGYTGHVQDAATGLTYMQQRYYDAGVGRFLSADPVAAREGGDNFNRHAYAANNPFTFTDPDGRDVEVKLMAYRIGTAPIQGDYGHQYMHLRDTESGAEMISRAGPSEPYPGGVTDVASGSPVENAAGTGDVTLVTSLTPASVSSDSQAGVPLGSTVEGSAVTIPGNIDRVVEKVQAFNNAVDTADIAYKPTSTNSNAYAGTAYTNLTGKDAPSSGFLPGSDINLDRDGHMDKK